MCLVLDFRLQENFNTEEKKSILIKKSQKGDKKVNEAKNKEADNLEVRIKENVTGKLCNQLWRKKEEKYDFLDKVDNPREIKKDSLNEMKEFDVILLSDSEDDNLKKGRKNDDLIILRNTDNLLMNETGINSDAFKNNEENIFCIQVNRRNDVNDGLIISSSGDEETECAKNSDENIKSLLQKFVNIRLESSKKAKINLNSNQKQPKKFSKKLQLDSKVPLNADKLVITNNQLSEHKLNCNVHESSPLPFHARMKKIYESASIFKN